MFLNQFQIIQVAPPETDAIGWFNVFICGPLKIQIAILNR